MFLPISLNITDKKILIVGGGDVALHKLRTLIHFADDITVIAPVISDQIRALGVRCIVSSYAAHYLNAGCFLVFACTNDSAINERIKTDAEKKKMLVNIADNGKESNFISPAIYRAGAMTVAISSQGTDVKRSVLWRNIIKSAYSMPQKAPLICYSFDYRSAPVAMREHISARKQELRQFIDTQQGSYELLSTCNRIEVYGIFNAKNDRTVFQEQFECRFPELMPYVVIYDDTRAVFTHMIMLAAGLKSQLIGERQIVEQLARWYARDTFDPIVHDFFQKSVAIAHYLRIAYALDHHYHDIADVVYDHLYPDAPVCAEQKNIVLLGSGKVAELFAQKEKGACLHFVSRKKYARATQLAHFAHGKAYSFEALPELLNTADVLITAVTCPRRLVEHDMLKALTVQRRRELTIYDISMPRAVDPAVSALEGIRYYDLDTLDTPCALRRAAHESLIADVEKELTFLIQLVMFQGEWDGAGCDTAEHISA